uniref:Uncharacterized protein n=1 Tax=Helianthus annuus TaxID=4232 RepID=A0A251VDA9_HELAN
MNHRARYILVLIRSQCNAPCILVGIGPVHYYIRFYVNSLYHHTNPTLSPIVRTAVARPLPSREISSWSLGDWNRSLLAGKQEWSWSC